MGKASLEGVDASNMSREKSYRAVMIEDVNAIVAVLAVSGSIRSPNIANSAEIGL